MYKLTLFLGLFLLITSCAPINNIQLYKTEAPDLKVDKGLLVFEDSVCSISYDLWSKNGNPTFLFYNKSDYLISIDLTECFFVLNGISYDYFQNRTYTHSSGTSRTVGNVVSSGNTNSTTTSTNSANSAPPIFHKYPLILRVNRQHKVCHQPNLPCLALQLQLVIQYLMQKKM